RRLAGTRPPPPWRGPVGCAAGTNPSESARIRGRQYRQRNAQEKGILMNGHLPRGLAPGRSSADSSIGARREQAYNV
ncbi:MAG TPA: hypothetical protein VM366_16795, partial [Anaerolineae bacterium]|nr:hypothetical protein [Anaerolineae bacterium]